MSQRQFAIPKALSDYLEAVEGGQDGCLLMITADPGDDSFTANLVMTDAGDSSRPNVLQPVAESLCELFDGHDDSADVPAGANFVHPTNSRIN